MPNKKKRWWATGIFLRTEKKGKEPVVYTLSVHIHKLMSGEDIQKRLQAEDTKLHEDSDAELVKVIMTQDTYSPMEWWAHMPAVIARNPRTGSKMLWGDGEGINESSWEDWSEVLPFSLMMRDEEEGWQTYGVYETREDAEVAEKKLSAKYNCPTKVVNTKE